MKKAVSLVLLLSLVIACFSALSTVTVAAEEDPFVRKVTLNMSSAASYYAIDASGGGLSGLPEGTTEWKVTVYNPYNTFNGATSNPSGGQNIPVHGKEY